MTVFKTYLKILNKNKFIVLLYTVILLVFGISNFQNSEKSLSFVASKPDITIVNYDDNKGVTRGLIDYLEKTSNVSIVDEDSSALDDSLFYRENNYIIYIPKGFNDDFLKGNNPELEIKSTGDYQASFASMLTSRYIKVASAYQKMNLSESTLVSKVEETLKQETNINLTSKLDSTSLEKAAYYYSFASYSIFATLIYVICIILSVFNSEKIKKRTIISSTNYKKNNRILLLANCLFAFVVWIFYVFISFILVGKTLFSLHGLLFIINSLVFTLCAASIAFFIGALVQNKNAINGIVNVVALGSSFLCGAFVPQEWLPDFVLKIAHILPTYYYINNNNYLVSLERFNSESLMPLFINLIAMIVFIIIFIVLTNIVSKKKRKIA